MTPTRRLALLALAAALPATASAQLPRVLVLTTGGTMAAARVIATPEVRGWGVLVVLNDEIHGSRDVKKMDSNRVDAFQSPEWGALGLVDSDRVLIHRAPLRRHTTTSALRLPTEPLPDVPIVMDYAGSDGSVVRHWVERGVPGIVVQAFANGRASPGTTAAMREAAAAGIPVALASRVPEGRVMDRGEGLIVAAGDLPPHQAHVLLMLALVRTRDGDELRRIFTTH